MPASSLATNVTTTSAACSVVAGGSVLFGSPPQKRRAIAVAMPTMRWSGLMTVMAAKTVVAVAASCDGAATNKTMTNYDCTAGDAAPGAFGIIRSNRNDIGSSGRGGYGEENALVLAAKAVATFIMDRGGGRGVIVIIDGVSLEEAVARASGGARWG